MGWEEKVAKMAVKHTIAGCEFSYSTLKDSTVLKTYTDSSHFERKLVKQNSTGLLFLYEFYEWEDFSGGNDEIYETYSIISDEADADKLNAERNIKRKPYIFVDNNYNIKVVE